MATSVGVRAKRRFRFERFWTKVHGFHDVVASCWADTAAPADPLKRLGHKLRSLGRHLQRWSRREIGSIKDQLLVAHEVIARLDQAQELRLLSPNELSLRRNLKRRLLGLASLERTIARQRARVAGVREGDANAQFFRIYAAKRSMRNHISCLRSGDRIVSEQAELEQVATDFFVGSIGTAQERQHDISLAHLGLPDVDVSCLEANFSDDEAKKMLSTKADDNEKLSLEAKHNLV
ncbi:hypothetical protein ACQ4PT_047047 [Festuca glaucescens]